MGVLVQGLTLSVLCRTRRVANPRVLLVLQRLHPGLLQRGGSYQLQQLPDIHRWGRHGYAVRPW